MYYDLDSVNREAELGIVIGDRDYWSGAYGYDAVVTLLEFMFSVRNLKRVYLHTLQWNDRAQKCFARCGFTPVREVRRMGQDFLLMEVLRADWLEKLEERLSCRWDYWRDKGGERVCDEELPVLSQGQSDS
jgi:RimJ/RimL family protein N-acetyltransferase